MKKTQDKKTQPKKIQGIVVNVIGEKTIKVRVETKFPHPLYKKIIKTHKNYLAHITKGKCEKGDIVWISEGKPVSKSKKFYLVEKVK